MAGGWIGIQRLSGIRCGLRSHSMILLGAIALTPAVRSAPVETTPVYQAWPIGWVRKDGARTTIEVDARYQPALLGLSAGMRIWVLYWLDRNDQPERRAILQVHPQGDPAHPLRGVFATRAPVRPNPIGLSRCRVRSVQGRIIEIDGIDAFTDTPVLDIKPPSPDD